MTVKVTAIRPAVVTPPPSSVTITLDFYDAEVLRTMLGGLKREVRRQAVTSNGGASCDADRARWLVKEIIDALDAEGVKKLDVGDTLGETTVVQVETRPSEDEDEDEDDDHDYGYDYDYDEENGSVEVDF